MKKQLVIIGIITILIGVGLSGCNENSSSEKDKFIGVWKSDDPKAESKLGKTLIFYSNGTMYLDWNTKQTWKIEGDTIIITLPESQVVLDWNYRFLNNDKTLEFTCPECDGPQVFVRQ